MWKVRLAVVVIALSSTHALAADSALESALSGCAAIKNSKQKADCYEAVTKLAAQSKPAIVPPPAVESPQVSKYADFIAKAKSHITRDLKDPSTVQWRGLFVSGDQMPVLCGELNAKNSYGAYVGFKRFYATEDPVLQDIENDKMPELMAGMWPSMCSKKVDGAGNPASPTGVDDSQKEKWITALARRNGCEGGVQVKSWILDAKREKFEATCLNKTLEFTCEFGGEIIESMNGLPFVKVTGKSYTTQSACWL